MTTYIMKRLIEGLIVLFLVTISIFLIIRVLPGDPILMYLSQGESISFSQEQRAALEHEQGLDRPVAVQYLDWLTAVFSGDLGQSIFKHAKVTSLLAQRLPITMYLGSIALVISIFWGIFIGVIAAVRRNTWMDYVATFIANIGITVPIFWLGILLIYFFGLFLRWLPIYGFVMPTEDFWLSTRQAILPVACLAVFSVASLARQTRSSMLEIIHQDYIRTAWAKGLKERVVITRHAMKNGLIPVITLAGTQIRNIVGGAVLIETVFNIPGMGRLVVEGIFNQDYAVVQGVILIIALIIILSNFLVDLSYSWVDPRVRYS